jgi:hypothetical protein
LRTTPQKSQSALRIRLMDVFNRLLGFYFVGQYTRHLGA